MLLLVLNCGSATVKFQLFEESDGSLARLDGGTREVDDNHAAAITAILDDLPKRPDLVGHRVVHGGDRFTAPTLIDSDVIEGIREVSVLAPLHNPPALSGIEAIARLGLPQVAIFDTAFHRTLPPEAFTYALPQKLAREKGLRRYGFHGISHESVMQAYSHITGNETPTIITLHLGNGASATAIREGECIDTTMGLTPLEGLVMGSRPGDLDPGIPLALLRDGMGLDELEHILWHESGLKGLAGDNDMRALTARDDAEAKLAVEIFCYRVRKCIGAFYAALGKLEAVIFTGGIGEKSAKVRSGILVPLAGLGIMIDEGENLSADGSSIHMISAANSEIGAWVIPTNEESLIAEQALGVARSAGIV